MQRKGMSRNHRTFSANLSVWVTASLSGSRVFEVSRDSTIPPHRWHVNNSLFCWDCGILEFCFFCNERSLRTSDTFRGLIDNSDGNPLLSDLFERSRTRRDYLLWESLRISRETLIEIVLWAVWCWHTGGWEPHQHREDAYKYHCREIVGAQLFWIVPLSISICNDKDEELVEEKEEKVSTV